MKITFLGTSHGVPEFNRQCTCTMIEVDEKIYFIDMGIMPVQELIKRGKTPDDVALAIFTHCHGDHTNGLVSFWDLCSWRFKEADPQIIMPRQEHFEIIQAWIKANSIEPRPLRYGVVREGVCFEDEKVKITAMPNQHIADSFSYLFEAEGKRLLFTGDLKNPKVDFPAVSGKLDLLVCESAHFNTCDYLDVIKDMDIAKIMVHHISKRFNDDAERFHTLVKVDSHTASDGEEIII